MAEVDAERLMERFADYLNDRARLVLGEAIKEDRADKVGYGNGLKEAAKMATKILAKMRAHSSEATANRDDDICQSW